MDHEDPEVGQTHGVFANKEAINHRNHEPPGALQIRSKTQGVQVLKAPQNRSFRLLGGHKQVFASFSSPFFFEMKRVFLQ